MLHSSTGLSLALQQVTPFSFPELMICKHGSRMLHLSYVLRLTVAHMTSGAVDLAGNALRGSMRLLVSCTSEANSVGAANYV